MFAASLLWDCAVLSNGLHDVFCWIAACLQHWCIFSGVQVAQPIRYPAIESGFALDAEIEGRATNLRSAISCASRHEISANLICIKSDTVTVGQGAKPGLVTGRDRPLTKTAEPL